MTAFVGLILRGIGKAVLAFAIAVAALIWFVAEIVNPKDRP